ncbi:MAG: hypothetical protein KF861_17755 [Planctomycetaceae bacterium]|nr:hypothetical protein [Planctomycetaceae bacterium]
MNIVEFKDVLASASNMVENPDFHHWKTDAAVLLALYFLPKGWGVSANDLATTFREVGFPAIPQEVITSVQAHAYYRRAACQSVGADRIYSLNAPNRQEIEVREASSPFKRVDKNPEPEVASVSEALRQHVEHLPEGHERRFADEALLCLGVGAHRAAIVMGWNLAYDHLRRWLFSDQNRIQRFNSVLKTKYKDKRSGVFHTELVWGASKSCTTSYEGLSLPTFLPHGLMATQAEREFF